MQEHAPPTVPGNDATDHVPPPAKAFNQQPTTSDNDLQHCIYEAAHVQVSSAASIVDFTAYAMPVYCVLHLFSGRRRHNDVQAQLEYVTAFETYTVITLSLDLAVHEVYGDLSDNTVLCHWFLQCRRGLVVGFVAGPPCETWSAARHNMLEDASAPPLRSEQHPWGLDSLELKHYIQLATGSKLLQVVLLFFTVLLGNGGFGLAEHPAKSKTVRTAASIWKLSYTRFLQKTPAIQTHTFDQDVHGQISRKPTTFMCLRLATIRQYLYSYQGGEKKLPQGPLIGKSADGTFKSAPAKEYPESLNRAIALAIKDTLDSNLLGRQSHYPTDHEIDEVTLHHALFQQFDPYNPEAFQKMHADYLAAGGKHAARHAPGHDRAQAAAYASRILQTGGIPSDSDILEMLRLWRFTKNTRRKNVLPQARSWVHSDALGLLVNGGHNGITSVTDGHEDVFKVLHIWVSARLYGHAETTIPCTTITINKGFAAAPHRDKGNLGPSVVVSIGPHTGGRLRYWTQDDASTTVEEAQRAPYVTIPVHQGPAVFDGNKLHSVEQFIGERFSIVLYTTSRYAEASSDTVTAMHTNLGIHMPQAADLKLLKALIATHGTANTVCPATAEEIASILHAQEAYTVLRLSPAASLATAKAAYRRIIIAVHPDKTSHPRAAEAFRKVQQAYHSVTAEIHAAASSGPVHLFQRETGKGRGTDDELRPQGPQRQPHHRTTIPHQPRCASQCPQPQPPPSQSNGTGGQQCIGILNLGNTCYLNAALQLLAATAGPVPRRTAAIPPPSLDGALTEVLQHIQSSSHPSPAKILRRLRQAYPQYRGHSQHDAHELLTRLILALPAECKAKYCGSFATTLRHPETGHVSVNSQSYTTMQVPFVQGLQDVQHLLNHSLQAETLEPSEWTRCPVNGAPRQTIRCTRIADAPQIHIIQLMRFSADRQGGQIKNQSAIAVPTWLAVNDLWYRQTATIVHHGTLHSGHYTTIVHRSDGNLYIDDATVYSISTAKAAQLAQQAYILAYTRN